MYNANYGKQKVIDSTSGPEVNKLVWNHLYHSLEILLKESMDSTYGNNRANAYMLRRQLTAVDKHYQKTYGEYPRTGDKIPSPVLRPRSYRQEQRSKFQSLLNTFSTHTEWTQKDIAKFLGIPQSAVSTWNTGKAKMPEKHEKRLIEVLRAEVPEFKERYDQYQKDRMKRASNY
jgi:predicted XRE-type DNA-binding protein